MSRLFLYIHLSCIYFLYGTQLPFTYVCMYIYQVKMSAVLFEVFLLIKLNEFRDFGHSVMEFVEKISSEYKKNTFLMLH